jgi:hypothetical protein
MSDIRPLTLQEIFDITWEKYIVNDIPKVAKTETYRGKSICAYRDSEGNKCFIGQFISDHEYNESYEAKSIAVLYNDIPFRNTEARLLLSEIHPNILSKFQSAHDIALKMRAPARIKTTWRRGLQTLAKTYGLTIPGDKR